MTGPADLAGEVARIDLLGGPQAILVDPEAIGADGTPVGNQVRRLLTALGLEVVPIGAHKLMLTGITVAIFGRSHPLVTGCYAWYVGQGAGPRWMHPTAGDGPRTAVAILSFLGTGFAQERAGAAFRAAGAGRRLPRSSPYDAAAILGGITEAVAPRSAVSRGAPVSSPPIDEWTRRQLLRQAFVALDRCCAANGAIAAAPPMAQRQGPDYWFFWQRDAAHAAFALQSLAILGPDGDVRGGARTRLDGYVAFIAELGPALARHPAGIAAGRCTMAGTPVGGYGDPQHDGPAATALAVLSVVENPRSALAVAKPFLDHLLTLEPHHAGFDLWELTVGTSFHAVNLARRALRRAADVGTVAEDADATSYRAAAERLAFQLNAFRDPGLGGLVHTQGPQPPWFGATTRLDMSVIGSTLLGYDVTDDVLNVDDRDMAATMRRLEDHFATRWGVNAAWQLAGRVGGGIGRFPEDCNDGIGSTRGSPWPVTTLWAAQYHLRRAQRCAHLASTDPAYQDREIANGLAYLDFVLAHVDVTAISEQIDGVTGRARGASSLAWAHAELVTTLLARATLA